MHNYSYEKYSYDGINIFMYSNFYKKNSHNAKVVQKIINSKSSTELKFEYTGDTKNNLPHTSKGHGKKKFEYVDEVRIKQLREQSMCVFARQSM